MRCPQFLYLLRLRAARVLRLSEALHVKSEPADARHAAVGLLHRRPVVAGNVVEDLGDVAHVLVGGDVCLVRLSADVERGGVLAEKGGTKLRILAVSSEHSGIDILDSRLVDE